jgi:hypothetical protein
VLHAGVRKKTTGKQVVLQQPVKEFKQMLSAWPARKAGMDVRVTPIKQADLPAWIRAVPDAQGLAAADVADAAAPSRPSEDEPGAPPPTAAAAAGQDQKPPAAGSKSPTKAAAAAAAGAGGADAARKRKREDDAAAAAAAEAEREDMAVQGADAGAPGVKQENGVPPAAGSPRPGKQAKAEPGAAAAAVKQEALKQEQA